VFKIDNNYLLRLPRTKNASEVMRYEQLVLKNFYITSSVKVPKIIFEGHSNKYYPFYYSIYQYIEGSDLFHTSDVDMNSVANDLGEFINALHKTQCDDLRLSNRGNGLQKQNDEFLKALDIFDEKYSKNDILTLWNKLMQVPTWKSSPVTIHSDILPMNIIIKNSKLEAVIDFSYVGYGDPAVDLMPAWTIFDKETRPIFLSKINYDKNTLFRAMGWALSFAIIAIPYYKHKNSAIYEIALNTLEEVLLDNFIFPN
jgi:aminoglycoside phosphotransferase (APT) family kinase protein